MRERGELTNTICNMEHRAFGQCTHAIIDPSGGGISLTVDGSQFKSMFIIALEGAVVITDIIEAYPLPADLEVSLTASTLVRSTAVTLPASGQLGGLRTCIVASGAICQVLFLP
jgi:hypothetical protein